MPIVGSNIKVACFNILSEFKWTEKHISFENLEQLRHLGDNDADEVLSILESWSNDDVVKKQHFRGGNILETMSLYLSEHADLISENQIGSVRELNYLHVKQFVRNLGTVPSWVNWQQMERGQIVYMKVSQIYSKLGY